MSKEREKKQHEEWRRAKSEEAREHLQKGSLYLYQQKTGKALGQFQEALAKDPQNTYIHYNIAYMLRGMGHEKEKIQAFKEILGESENSSPENFFQGGVFYALREEPQKARLYLQKYLDTNPRGRLYLETKELLRYLSGEDHPYVNPAYIRICNKYAGEIESVREKVKEKLDCPFGRIAMLESLYKELEDDTISSIIFLYGLATNSPVSERVLRQYIKNSWVKEEHKELALLALRDMGAEEPYEIMIYNRLERLTLKEYFERLDKSEWQPLWHEVLTLALEKVKCNDQYDNYQGKILEGGLDFIWSKFLNKAYPLVPQIDDKKTWAAALEYYVLKKRNFKVSHKEAALRYGASPARIKEIHTLINNILGSSI